MTIDGQRLAQAKAKLAEWQRSFGSCQECALDGELEWALGVIDELLLEALGLLRRARGELSYETGDAIDEFLSKCSTVGFEPTDERGRE